MPLLQFHGNVSWWTFEAESGAVGSLLQAAAVPSRATARMRRTMNWRDTGTLHEEGVRRKGMPAGAGRLTRHVTFCYAT